MKKKDLKIAIFSSFIGIVFTAIYDWIKSKPILSTFWGGLKWIWNNIFEFQLTVWQVLLVIGLLILILYLLAKREDENQINKFDWRSYVSDRIHNMNWCWLWEKNILEGKWQIKDLSPVCDSCGTKMNLNENWKRSFAECPRCGKVYNEGKDLIKIKSVIIDNV